MATEIKVWQIVDGDLNSLEESNRGLPNKTGL